VDLDTLFRLLAERGDAQYGEEAVSQLEHALQCAALARREGADAALVTAALFHDVGHLIADDEFAAREGRDMHHEDVGADVLEEVFGAAVAGPVRLHVPAKRYLCATDSAYFDGLSQASRTSLAVQGGPFTPEEAARFARDPAAAAAVRLRRWDDRAKDPAAATPPLEDFRREAEAARLGG
jgi:phosphonate degradation associated HDIG domain protein